MPLETSTTPVHGTTLYNLKQDIQHLHRQSRQGFFLGTRDQDHLTEERPTLFHLVKRKYAKACHISSVQDDDGTVHTSATNIIRTFTTHLSRKLTAIPILPTDIHSFLAGVHVRLPVEAHAAFSLPITEDELNVAVRSGKRNKAPGLDGIPTDFFQLTWDITKADILSLVNEMYQTDALPSTQQRGIVVCVPKIPLPTVPTDYRFLTPQHRLKTVCTTSSQST
jgi:hypothetical protein